MAELKTKATAVSVHDFLKTVESEDKQRDAFTLLTLFEDITGEAAIVWGSSIVGFGNYHYKSERSTQEGDWFLTGFSPRKQNLTLYVMMSDTVKELLAKLGKHKTSVGCLYINKLADVNMEVLKDVIAAAFSDAKKVHNVQEYKATV